MKKFTCSEMGGPCDMAIEGETMEEVTQKGGEHVMAMSDPAHQTIAETTKNSSPEEKEKWNSWFKELWDKKEDVQ